MLTPPLKMPSWAQLKAKAKSWVHSKKRSPTDAYSDSSEDGHSPRQEPDTRRVMVPAPPAPGLFRSLAEPAQNLFAAPAGATAHPDPAQLPGEHHRKEKSALRLLAEEAGGAGVAPAEHWGRAYLDGTRQRRASHGEKQVTHEQSTREHGESAKDRGGGEEQAVGVLEQMGGQQGSCGPPSPQGVTQVGAVAGPTEAETANDRAAARGVDTELAGSCHINIGAAETPKAESEQGSKLKGKAQEVPDNSKGDKSYIPMSRYDHILAAIALPAASPREGAPWWEQAPAASDQRSGGESSGSQASRLHQILSAVAIPTTEPAPAVETLQDSSNKRDENEAGPSDGGGFLGLGAGRGAETSEKPAAEVKEGDAGEVRQDQGEDATKCKG